MDEGLHTPGVPYRIPRGGVNDYYFRVPEAFWARGLLGDEDLSGAGLALYLIALRTYEIARIKDSLTFPAASFQERYGLGESTRKKGLKNLEDLAVLYRNRATVDDRGGVGHRLRQRNTYELSPQFLPPQPSSTSSTTVQNPAQVRQTSSVKD